MKRKRSRRSRGTLVLLTAVCLSLTAGSALLVAPSEAAAQGRGREGAEREGPSIDRLAERLGLSDEQRNLVEPILAAHHERMKQLHENERLDRDVRQRLAEQYRGELEEELAAVLTDEQLTKFREMRPPRRGGGRGQRPTR